MLINSSHVNKKIAMVTGASRGIGYAIAGHLYNLGFSVAMCARNDERLSQAVARIQNDHSDSHGQLLPVVCDIANYDEVVIAVAKILEQLGPVGVLVNNAAISPINNGQRFHINEISNDDWHQVMQTNLTGAFYCIKAVLPSMMTQRFGHIINISSALERTGAGLGNAAYIASKGGLAALTRALTHDLGDYNIKANTVSPGRTATDMVANIPENSRWANEHIPLKRLGKPQDIAKLVAFLVNDKECFINGANIDCNGGWVAR